jgi:hypothetical protein
MLSNFRNTRWTRGRARSDMHYPRTASASARRRQPPDGMPNLRQIQPLSISDGSTRPSSRISELWIMESAERWRPRNHLVLASMRLRYSLEPTASTNRNAVSGASFSTRYQRNLPEDVVLRPRANHAIHGRFRACCFWAWCFWVISRASAFRSFQNSGVNAMSAPPAS